MLRCLSLWLLLSVVQLGLFYLSYFGGMCSFIFNAKNLSKVSTGPWFNKNENQLRKAADTQKPFRESDRNIPCFFQIK